MTEIEQFFTESQKQEIAVETQRLANSLKFPTFRLAIIQLCSKNQLSDDIKQIDPKNTILTSKVTEINLKVLSNQFKSLWRQIMEGFEFSNIAQTMSNEVDQIKLKQIAKMVIRNYGGDETSLYRMFSQALKENYSQHQFENKLMKIASIIYQFIHSRYDMPMIQAEMLFDLGTIQKQIRDKLYKRPKSQDQLHFQELWVSQSKLHQSKQPSPQFKELVEVCNSIQKNEIILEKKESNNETNNSQDQSGFFAKLKNSPKYLMGKIATYINNRGGDLKQQHLAIDQNFKQYLFNLENHFENTQQEKNSIQQLENLHLTELKELLNNEFTSSQIKIIRQCIENTIIDKTKELNPIQKEKPEIVIKGIKSILSYAEKMQESLNEITESVKSSKHSNFKYFCLVGLLYRSIQDIYSPFAKRFLMDVLTHLEKNQLDNNQQIYLKGALRIIQSKYIKPTNFANLLAKEIPKRCEKFQQTYDSLVLNSGYQDQLKLQIKITMDKTLHQISTKQGIKMPLNNSIQLLKLTHSNQTKTVTFLISGFLSQDTEKDLQWMGMIHSMKQTEVYSFNWESSSFKQVTGYLSKVTSDVLLHPVNNTGYILPKRFYSAIKLGYDLYKGYKDYPFSDAHKNSTLAGIYLAQLIMLHFPDRFVNLVGFSLGTEVIRSCVQKMFEKGQVRLINRIMTLGGVADKEEVRILLQKYSYPLDWRNLWSDNDATVRYLYRFYNRNSTPIGTGDMDKVLGHQINNFNGSSLIKGHLDFRDHLYVIGKMSDICHD